jgi:4-aminobutyrate aminotransferase/(S)-3-amino-2-methylpropionate transaminase
MTSTSTLLSLEPRAVPPVETKHRRIRTSLPVPESIPILKKLQELEPQSMSGQPPILWDRAEGFNVYDAWGNKWIDWSSGVLVANAGHSHPKVVEAVRRQLDRPLMHTYCFPSEPRARLVEKLASLAPEGLDKVFLLTTGSEATECCIKLMRKHGAAVGGNGKLAIVTFVNGFHGRTMGSQMAGGWPAQKEWIVNLDPAMVQVPYPDGFRQADTSFDVFLNSLAEQGLGPDQVAGVMLETYQGGSARFAPVDYIKRLAEWCDSHNIVLAFDEVQAGCGRTGKFWGFEHYGVTPDLIACGKGISSGLPLSAVIGTPRLMDQFPPGSMTSTHTGNPICAAAALAALEAIAEEDMVSNAARIGEILDDELSRLQAKHGAAAGPIGAADAKGAVATLQMVEPGTTTPHPTFAAEIVRGAIDRGVLMFSPVGTGGGTVKISPPLMTPEDALREALGVLTAACAEALS